MDLKSGKELHFLYMLVAEENNAGTPRLRQNNKRHFEMN